MSIDIHYFVSSLPVLKRGERPLISHQQLLESCRDFLNEEDADAIAALSLDISGEPPKSSLSTARQWWNYEAFIRNAAAVIRAGRLHRTAPLPASTDFISQYDQRQLENAFSLPSPAEREQILDTMRWNILDSLETGHFHDLEFIAIYALKLLLLERIASRNLEQGLNAFDASVEDGIRQAEAVRH